MSADDPRDTGLPGRELLAIRARTARARTGQHQSLRQTEADRDALMEYVRELEARLVVGAMDARVDELMQRAEQAEAERDAMVALMERMPDAHARFSVVGSDEPPKCADWCGACRLERLAAERDALKATVERVRYLCKLTIATSCRMQAINQAEDTLRILDAPSAPQTTTAQEGPR
jgi:hypothetical protein